jgi:hypothetical protein
MGGLKCRACRRFVLRWPHITLLVILAVAAFIGLIEIALW